MTDRFYPLGLPHEADAWKTTYEVQNEMRTFPRSAYPPGTAVHLPGARDSFGFSSPGPVRHRLAQGHLHETGAVDIPNPRESHAMLRLREQDEREIFRTTDATEMGKSYRSRVAEVSFSPAATPSACAAKSLRKTFSLPSLAPPRVSTPPDPAEHLEDNHFSYFVPKAMQKAGHEKLNPHRLHKLHKADRVSFPFSGEGTGFRSQSGPTGVFPSGGTYEGITTSSHANFQRPNFATRHAPADRGA
mmetsp:Transcript_20024/g.58143  ORF Transcript_20024/g.58143 Transcript_20024/m.58143 type:complete len:245 (+) Transcript_20024:88-822(+)